MEKLSDIFFSFKKPVGEKFVWYAYLLGVSLITLWTLIIVFGALKNGFFAFLGMLVVSPLIFGIFLVLWRLVCEALRALFAIEKALTQTDADTQDPASQEINP